MSSQRYKILYKEGEAEISEKKSRFIAHIAPAQTEEEAQDFVSEEKGVETVADAINGAKDIIAEHISDEADYRIYLRKLRLLH